MHEQTPRNLPWLDRLTASLPGYGGYQSRANRRAADRVLRDAIALRLERLNAEIERAVAACVDRGALTEVRSLERISQHLQRVAARVRSVGSGTDHFYEAADLEASKADSLHAVDLALFDRADALARHFNEPDTSHNRLAEIEADLTAFEVKLDERVLMLQGIR